MVVVIKVFKPVVKLMVVDPSHNRPHIMKLDEACVPPALDNTCFVGKQMVTREFMW
jgi:hypothetical protein